MNKYRWLIPFVVILVMVFLPTLLYAQTDPAGSPDAPIDGGVSILIAAGVAYGVKKYRNSKRNEEEQEISEK